MAGLRWIHLTARMSSAAPDLSKADTGRWLWTHLRAAFPEAIAVTLMPDHPHLVLASEDADAEQQRLARLLGQFGRRFGVRGQASVVAPAEPIRGGPVLARQVRYVALNPCRKHLVACPLAWRWSTHRDVVGASVDPWVGAGRLARALESAPRGFARRHHAYVSADPSARVDGTPFPVAAAQTAMPAFALRAIAEASAAALRVPLAAVRDRSEARALFIALAFDQGWTHVARLAAACGCGRHAIRRRAADIDAAALDAARLCLGDARLSSRREAATR